MAHNFACTANATIAKPPKLFAAMQQILLKVFYCIPSRVV